MFRIGKNCGKEGKRGKGLIPFSFGREETGKGRGKGEKERRVELTFEGFILVVSVILAECEEFSKEVYLADRTLVC